MRNILEEARGATRYEKPRQILMKKLLENLCKLMNISPYYLYLSGSGDTTALDLLGQDTGDSGGLGVPTDYFRRICKVDGL